VTATVRGFREADVPGVRAIMEACLAVDEIPGFIEADIDRALVRMVPDPGGTVVALEGDRIVGYCTPNHDDLSVHPAARRRGHGRRLVAAAQDVVRDRGDDVLQLYVPSHQEASVRFAEAVGLRYRSSLWRFELPPGRPVPAADFPPEVVIRPFEDARDGDMAAWSAFMLAAFEGHPTPMHWSPAVIAHVHATPGFDRSLIRIVSPADDPDRRIAFTRLELFEMDRPPGERLGDIGLIGVLPAWRRHGLGRELLRWGVSELRARGAGLVELSVEAENERATTLYRAHGFEPAIEWPHWVLPTGVGPA
jgi:mycothiol synthase